MMNEKAKPPQEASQEASGWKWRRGQGPEHPTLEQQKREAASEEKKWHERSAAEIEKERKEMRKGKI